MFQDFKHKDENFCHFKRICNRYLSKNYVSMVFRFREFLGNQIWYFAKEFYNTARYKKIIYYRHKLIFIIVDYHVFKSDFNDNHQVIVYYFHSYLIHRQIDAYGIVFFYFGCNNGDVRNHN